ncbi:MAG: hypothetical protein ISS50_00475 [Anaerolineae bacterium]|nr:hypothetical protein [Anaerolineae bacterium]
MNRKMLLQGMVGLTLVALLLVGCGMPAVTPTPVPTASPYPTYTPVPTATPYPTYTPLPPTPTPTAVPLTATPTPVSTPTVGDTVIGSHWKVKVVKVETGDEFGPRGFEEDARNHFVIVTLEYTYLGAGRAEFFPESVVLVYTGSTGLQGWAQTPILHRGEFSSQVVDFTEDVAVNYLDSGDTRTEVFVYEFRDTYTDFRLYFPETQAIAISLE